MHITRNAALIALLFVVAASKADTVTGRQRDSALVVPAATQREVERLAIALLTSSTYEAQPATASEKRWDQALHGPHIRIVFSEPQTFSFRFSTIGPAKAHVVHADDLLIPFSPTDYALIRFHGQVRGFAKFTCESLTALRDALELPHE